MRTQRILLDTKGPEIRTGLFERRKESNPPGREYICTYIWKISLGDDTKVVSFLIKVLQKMYSQGTVILIDDGLIGLKVKEIVGSGMYCLLRS